jgi:hypothetical protein
MAGKEKGSASKPKKGMAVAAGSSPKAAGKKADKGKAPQPKAPGKEKVSEKAPGKASKKKQSLDKETKKSKGPEKKASTTGAYKIPAPKEVSIINRKLDASVKPVGKAASKYGDAKTVYSPEKEVVTTTHGKTPSLVSPTRRRSI